MGTSTGGLDKYKQPYTDAELRDIEVEFGFAPNEIDVLVSAPFGAGWWVTAADYSKLGAIKEGIAMIKEISTAPRGGPAKKLIALVRSKVKDVETDPLLSDFTSEELPDRALSVLSRASAIVDTTCEPDVAAGYKDWVADVAMAAAKASKEHGASHTGIKGVTDKEQAVLDRIDEALGR